MDRVVQQGVEDFNKLDAFNQMRFRRYVLMKMFEGEELFYQHKDGLMADETWQNWERGLARFRAELDEPQWEGWIKYFSTDYGKFLLELTPQPFVGF